MKLLFFIICTSKICFSCRWIDWKTHQLNRTLFDIPNLSSAGGKENFPNLKYESMEKLVCKVLDWLNPTLIKNYFEERLAAKEHENGRKLFMCGFLKSLYQFVVTDDIFIFRKCSAEQRKSTDYEIKVHLNCKERKIVKTCCGCPGGIGPNGACKHIGIVWCRILCSHR